MLYLYSKKKKKNIMKIDIYYFVKIILVKLVKFQHFV